ncbi:MAG: hypothetical protein JNN13_05590 [Planctomycetes bacterium]|nr:hypothetical protein [Planctomycetota bacterium]
MTNKRLSIVILSSALLLNIGVWLWWWHAAPRAAAGPTHATSATGRPGAASATLPPDAAFTAAQANVAAAIDRAMERLQRSKVESTSAQTASPNSGCSWPPGFRRSAESLPGLLLFGHLESADLARHVLLNERDVVLCPADVRELDALVADYNSAINPVISACLNVRVAEKVACIEAGVVKPWHPPSEPESQVAARAAALMVERDMSEAEARAEAVKLLRSAPEAPPGNYLKHDGRIYLSSDFPALPKTAAVYENVKFLVGEYAAVLIAWFVQRGLCTDPATPGRILEGISKKPAK